jgi:DNA-binding response OmpR family regulator
MKILLIDDNKDLGEILQVCLKPHWVHHSFSIHEAREVMSTEQFDLMIIDVGLPDGSGLEFCAELEQQGQSVPKVILSGDQDLKNKVYALTTGAVDYISKPFHIPELKARVELQLKNLQARGHEHRFGPFEFDQDFQNCFHLEDGGKKVLMNLTPTESKIFLILLRHHGDIVSKQEFLQQIWRTNGVSIAPRALDTHIANLRKKLVEYHTHIDCAWGRGYSCDLGGSKKQAS